MLAHPPDQARLLSAAGVPEIDCRTPGHIGWPATCYGLPIDNLPNMMQQQSTTLRGLPLTAWPICASALAQGQPDARCSGVEKQPGSPRHLLDGQIYPCMPASADASASMYAIEITTAPC